MIQRSLVLGVMATLCFGAAWLGCSDDQPPPLVTGDGGADGTSDAPIGDGGIPDGFDPDAPFDAGPAVCAQPMTFGAGTPVPTVSTPQTDRFGAITADELTIAWMNAAGTVLYADRAQKTDPFGATKSIAVGFALDRVALSADGLTLIGVITNRTTFAQVTRSSRSGSFGTTLDSAPFKFLNQPNGGSESDSGPSPDAVGVVSDPVLSADGKVFYFTLLAGTAETLAESLRLGGTTYPSPRVLKESDFVSSGSKLRRPTGLSFDGRTLFFWDETTNTERAAFRESATVPGKIAYTSFVTLGAYPGAQPSQTCGRLYFEGSGSGGVDLFVADRQ